MLKPEDERKDVIVDKNNKLIKDSGQWVQAREEKPQSDNGFCSKTTDSKFIAMVLKLSCAYETPEQLV